MLPCSESAEQIVWAMIDTSGGVKTRAVLQDAIFIGQELGLLNKTFDFPIWSGIGTARYSAQLDNVVTKLISSGRIYDSGGPASLKSLESSPKGLRAEVAPICRMIKSIDETSLSLTAAYVMAKRREQRDGIEGQMNLRRAARVRLGWPNRTISRIEKDLKELFDSPENYLGTAKEQIEIVLLLAEKAIKE